MTQFNADFDSYNFSTTISGWSVYYSVFDDGDYCDIDYIVTDESGEEDYTDHLKKSLGSGKLWQLIYADYEKQIEDEKNYY